MLVDEDEVGGLIGTLQKLEALKASNPVYLTYDEAKEILRVLYPDQNHLRVRFGRLWGAVIMAATRQDIPYDAYCTKCQAQVSQHYEESPDCSALLSSNRQTSVSVESLRQYEAAFLQGSLRNVGKGVREDYVYLIRHLSSM